MSGGKLGAAPKAITCWRCRRKIGLGAARRSCPKCGAELSVARYDGQARKVGNEASLLRARAEALRESGAASDEIERVDDEAASRLNLLKTLAEGRYYCDEWFRQTGMPLAHGRVESEVPVLNVTYDAEGRFKAEGNPRSVRSRGGYSEYEVYEALRDAASRGAFGHSRLLAHLFIPRERGSRGALSSAELDLVLVTEHKVYVIEVKGARCAVASWKDEGALRLVLETYPVDGEGRACGEPERSTAVSQVWGHRCALRGQALQGVSTSEITPVIVFPQCTEMRLLDGQGKSGIFVCSLGGEQDVVEVLAREDARTAVRHTPNEVDGIANRLAVQYGDPDGSRARLHVGEINLSRRLGATGEGAVR